MRPIYDALVKAMSKFGPDVEAAPKKAYVSFRRSKQFAIVQPSTKTRVDVGINLKGQPVAWRIPVASTRWSVTEFALNPPKKSTNNWSAGSSKRMNPLERVFLGEEA